MQREIRDHHQSRCTYKFSSSSYGTPFALSQSADWSISFDRQQHWLAPIPINIENRTTESAEKVASSVSVQDRDLLEAKEQNKKTLSTVTTMLVNPHHFSYLRALFYCVRIDKLPLLRCIVPAAGPSSSFGCIVKAMWSRLLFWTDRPVRVSLYRFSIQFISLARLLRFFHSAQLRPTWMKEWLYYTRIIHRTAEGYDWWVMIMMLVFHVAEKIPHCRSVQINKQFVNAFHFTSDLT